jgi:putative nucleotidyltransferase with HDIG domain
MQPFLTQVKTAMENYFGQDRNRIDHALQVADFARELLRSVDADEQLTLSAAYLHDIGIHEAERKHGSNAGKYQELEGPAIAASLLGSLGAEPGFIRSVCEMVGKHHTPAAIDSPEFRILWDADALVNLGEVLPGKSTRDINTILAKSMVTEPGLRLAAELFLPMAKEVNSPIDRVPSS